MARGFTLIETLISLVVLAVLLASVVPSFDGISERLKMQRLAEELQGFFVQTTSEAVLRNQELYLHFVQDGEPDSGEWAFVTNDSSNELANRNIAKINALMYLDGINFKNVVINFNAPSNTIAFGKVNGRPRSNGNITFSVTPSKSLSLKFHTRSSIRVCGVPEALYGYLKC